MNNLEATKNTAAQGKDQAAPNLPDEDLKKARSIKFSDTEWKNDKRYGCRTRPDSQRIYKNQDTLKQKSRPAGSTPTRRLCHYYCHYYLYYLTSTLYPFQLTACPYRSIIGRTGPYTLPSTNTPPIVSNRSPHWQCNLILMPCS